MKYDPLKNITTITIEDSFKDFDKLQKKNKRKIDRVTYKKIIAKFLRIWLYDFLWAPGLFYFPFGYLCEKYLIPEKYDIDKSSYDLKGKNVTKKFNNKVGVHWHIPDSANNRLKTKNLTKITGSTNVFPMAEKEWLKHHNVTDLLTLKNIKNKKIQHE